MTTKASDLETIWIPCNGCGADAFERLLTAGGLTVGRCSVCSLIYVNPMPFFKKTHYHDISKNYYYTKLQYTLSPTKIDFSKRQLASQLQEMPGAAQNGSPPTRFLDVGCGPGLAVHAATQMGWQASGIDIDADLVRLGRSEFGLDLRCSDFLESHFRDDEFSFIRFMSVLHLLPNPFEVLVDVRRVLTPTGGLLVVLPNEDGLMNQLHLWLGRRRHGRRGTLVLPYHLHAFTPVTLKRLLERAGLRVHRVGTASPVHPLYALMDQLKGGSPRRSLRTLAWHMAETIHRGSVVFAYAGK